METINLAIAFILGLVFGLVIIGELLKIKLKEIDKEIIRTRKKIIAEINQR